MSTMLASDAANPNFVGAHNPDSVLVVRFHRRPVLQPFETNVQGRPIFQDVDFIEIWTPGNQLNVIDTTVREEHKRRFPTQWANFQASHGTDTQLIGTPVSAWPFLTGSQAEEFKAVKFFTVEQIAGASDQQIQSLGMIGGANPHVIRARAQAYLDAAAGTAAPQAQAAELAETTAKLEALQLQMNQILNGLPVTEVKPQKRKRRTKAEMQAAQQVQEPEESVQSAEIHIPTKPIEVI